MQLSWLKVSYEVVVKLQVMAMVSADDLMGENPFPSSHMRLFACVISFQAVELRA